MYNYVLFFGDNYIMILKTTHHPGDLMYAHVMVWLSYKICPWKAYKQRKGDFWNLNLEQLAVAKAEPNSETARDTVHTNAGKIRSKLEPRGDAGGLGREYVLRIPSVSWKATKWGVVI